MLYVTRVRALVAVWLSTASVLRFEVLRLPLSCFQPNNYLMVILNATSILRMGARVLVVKHEIEGFGHHVAMYLQQAF